MNASESSEILKFSNEFWAYTLLVGKEGEGNHIFNVLPSYCFGHTTRLSNLCMIYILLKYKNKKKLPTLSQNKSLLPTIQTE